MVPWFDFVSESEMFTVVGTQVTLLISSLSIIDWTVVIMDWNLFSLVIWLLSDWTDRTTATLSPRISVKIFFNGVAYKISENSILNTQAASAPNDNACSSDVNEDDDTNGDLNERHDTGHAFTCINSSFFFRSRFVTVSRNSLMGRTYLSS